MGGQYLVRVHDACVFEHPRIYLADPKMQIMEKNFTSFPI